MSEFSQMLPCKQIRVPDGSPKLNDTTVQYLRDSIQTEGMYNPIVVRPDPERPGGYLVVQGRHRLHVQAKLLKAESILARVIDMDEDEARLAAMTENACRQSPNGTRRVMLIQQWQEAFRKKYPDLIGKKAGGKASGESRRSRSSKAKPDPKPAPEPAADANKDHSDPCSDGGDAPAPEPAPKPAAGNRPASFNKHVADATGQSTATVKRDIRIANGFTAEQLAVLDPLGIGKLDLLKILAATKGNENERAEVVNLVCSGMPADEAIKEVTGLSEVKDVAGRTRGSDEGEGGGAKAGDEAGLTDDEWFEAYCGEFAGLLANPARYRADAVAFRSMSDCRAAFRKKARKAFGRLKDTIKIVGLTPWFVACHKLLNASHPKDWLLCDHCVGKGTNPNGGSCKKCFEAGYFIKTEKYV